MKKKGMRILAFIMSIAMILSIFISPVSAAGGDSSESDSTISIADISELLNAISYKDYLAKYSSSPQSATATTVEIDPINDVDEDSTNVEKEVLDSYYGESNVLKVGDLGTITWKFNVPDTAFYYIQIEYCQIVGKTTSIERTFFINDEVPFSEARSLVLDKIWRYNYTVDEDGNDGFAIDKNGNDIRPAVVEDPSWQVYTMRDSKGFYNDPFTFYISAGENTITLESVREPMVIKSIKLIPVKDIVVPTYQEYLSAHGDVAQNTPSSTSIKIEGEHPANVSSVTVYPLNDRTSSITSGINGEQSAKVQKYNIVGGKQWKTVGEWLEYDLEVPESGYYKIAIRYKQDLLSGMYVSRRAYIDGELPFKEAADCRFDYSSSWESKFLGNNDGDFYFYLEKGSHKLKLEATLSDMADQIRQVSTSLTNLNNAYLKIIKLTGSSPDKKRTYNFSRVMPDVLETLMKESINLEKVYNYLKTTTGMSSENTSTLEQLYILLNKMASDEEEIAKNLETFKTQIGSLGTWVTNVSAQPLKVDYIQVQAENDKLPKDEGNFFQQFWFQIKLFIYSFITDYNSLGTTSDESSSTKPIEVWIASGRDQAQVIRNLIDNEFTPKTGVAVNLKLVTAGTLLPSVLAGVGPDVSLMEASNTVIQYALRSAVIPLNDFIENDEEDILARFPEAAMVPLTLYNYSENAEREKTYYGLPDKLNFSMLFYRKDILSELGLEIPRTWDDILAMIPILQYNNMTVGIQNDIYTFILQSGNEVYRDGGMRINFDSTGVLNAFDRLCSMYTKYDLNYQYDFVNRFRTGEMPLAIVDYTQCNQLTLFASELSDLWGFATLPGHVLTDDEGNTYIKNCAIAGVTGCLMLKGCKNQEEAWTFMKWYTGKDCQVKYSNDMVSIQGIGGRHPTPNIEAISEVPWTNEEKEQILAQFNNLEAVPNHPGSYYLARYINFAFLKAYNDKKDPAESLLAYVVTINKELTRRRIEFGMDYIDVATGQKVVQD